MRNKNINSKISPNKLNYWLMKNMKAMEELTVMQPACWAEADHPSD